MLFDATYGKENFPTASCQLWIFHVPLAAPGLPRIPEAHIWAAAKLGGSGITKASRAGANCIPASLMGDSKLGMWNDERFEVVDGTIIKLFATRKVGWSSMQEKAVIYLRARQGAALRKIDFATTRTPNISTRREIEAVNGRFDILTPGEVAQAGGIPLAGGLQPAASQVQIDRMFTLHVLSGETERTPIRVQTTVVNSSGEQVVVDTAKRRRVFED